jgi:Family of unknown function (DUF6492)
LASIDRWCEGFEEVVVVVPRKSLPWLRRARLPGSSARLEACADVPDDYLGQQVTKLEADLYTACDFVCHVDSDCVFHRPTHPEDLVREGRPLVRFCENRLLGRHRPWHGPTERFLGWPVAFDFMRHPPFTFPRWLYAEVRDHCRRVHGAELSAYVLGQRARAFSEFNVLGAYAYARHPEAFEWVQTGSGQVVDAHCHWYWSWGGLTPHIRSEIARSLSGR